MDENFSRLAKYTNLQIQEAECIPKRFNPKKEIKPKKRFNPEWRYHNVGKIKTK